MLLTSLEQFQIIFIFSIKLLCLDFSFTNLSLISVLILIFLSTIVFFSSKSNSFFFVPHNWQTLIEVLNETSLSLLYDNINEEDEMKKLKSNYLQFSNNEVSSGNFLAKSSQICNTIYWIDGMSTLSETTFIERSTFSIVGSDARTVADLESVTFINEYSYSIDANSGYETINLEQPELENISWDLLRRAYKNKCLENLDESSEMYSKLPDIRNVIINLRNLTSDDPYLSDEADFEVIHMLNNNIDYFHERVYLLKKVVYNIDFLEHSSPIIELLLKYSCHDTYSSLQHYIQSDVSFSIPTYHFVMNCLLISGAGIDDPNVVLGFYKDYFNNFENVLLYMDHFETYTHLHY